MSKEELLELNQKLTNEILNLRFQVDQFNHLLFGARRERFEKDHDDKQLTLPFEGEIEEEKPQDELIPVRATVRKKKTPWKS